MDVIEEARKKGDHNTAIMLRAALDHHALKQKKFKLRSKDHEMIRQMEEEYGTWRNCYKHHLKMAMDTNDLGILPSMMVLQMHVARHKAYSTIGGCRLKYDPNDIKGKIGMYGIQHIQEQYNEHCPCTRSHGQQIYGSNYVGTTSKISILYVYCIFKNEDNGRIQKNASWEKQVIRGIELEKNSFSKKAVNRWW